MKKSSLKYFNTLNNVDDMDSFKDAFHRFLLEDEREAIRYLNDKRLYFPTLFFVFSHEEPPKLKHKLNRRNQMALELCQVINGQRDWEEVNKGHGSKDVHETLIWMFNTGTYTDGLCDDYDKIIDGTVSLLICYVKDFSILPSAIELMFDRYEKDHYIHDIAWSIFQSKDVSILPLIGEYLTSESRKSIELAGKLLHVDKDVDTAQIKQDMKANLPYVYFTGESLQFSSEPSAVKVQLEGKYLNREVSRDSGELTKPLKKSEQVHIEEFRQRNFEEREQLSNYSHRLRSENPKLWRKWMKRELPEQMDLLQKDLEGANDPSK